MNATECHKEILRALNNSISILQPITTSESRKRKAVYIKPENIEELTTKSAFISSPACKVSVIDSAAIGQPFNPCYKPAFKLLQLEGGAFKYIILPEEIVNIRDKFEKVFKSIEGYNEKQQKNILPKTKIKHKFTTQNRPKCQRPSPNTLKSRSLPRTRKTQGKSRTKNSKSFVSLLKRILNILRLAR